MKKYEFIKTRLKELGKKQNQLAEFLGIEPPHVNAILSGIREIRPKEIAPLADFLHLDLKALTKYIAEQDVTVKQVIEGLDVTSIPVVGYVQAGVFQEANQWDKGNFYTVNPPIMPEYEGRNLFALEVRGDSMDKVYPAGTCIICVSVAEVGMPSSGKRVVCARNLPDGTVEATVKEYRETDSGTYLIPHSTNPMYVPYRLDDGSCGECEIVAIVVGSFQRE